MLKLVCSAETQLWIAADFEWKPRNIEWLNSIVEINSIDDTRKGKSSHLIDQFDLELTLTKRCIPRMQRFAQHRWINEALLVDSAFLPKTFTIKLELSYTLLRHRGSVYSPVRPSSRIWQISLSSATGVEGADRSTRRNENVGVEKVLWPEIGGAEKACEQKYLGDKLCSFLSLNVLAKLWEGDDSPYPVYSVCSFNEERGWMAEAD